MAVPPRPLRQFVLKVHSRCNLACDHCYVYEHADQTWRDRTQFMAAWTVRAAADRIAEHAAAHRLPRVNVVLHGGEPLLLGPDRLAETLAVLRAEIAAVAVLDLRMQSNGIRLTPQIADLLLDAGVKVGISFDGDRAANDRHRRYRNGASSYGQTRRALGLLRTPRYRRLYAGILCTVDVANDPIRVYEALLAEAPPHVDLLLPHATWDRPPAGTANGATPYAAWLLRIYHRWVADGCPVPIRLFDSLWSAGHGGPSGTEAVGLDPGNLAVIETDGAWEQPDSMKTAFHDAGATGLDIFAHTADDLTAHPAIRRRQGGLSVLSATCRVCPVVKQCGGGMFAHRYHPETGFDKPSVYCADLKELIVTMNEHPPLPAGDIGTLAPHVLEQLGSGYGDADCLRELASGQELITRALVRAVADRLDDSPEGRTAARAWALLPELDRTAPAAVRAVLTHPFIRPWAAACLDPDSAEPAWDRLACLVAAAAIRAGTRAEVVVRARDGRVHLPTLGAALVPGATEVVVSVAPDGFVLRWPGGSVTPAGGAGAPADGWLPVREAGGGELRISIEDADPYRDCHDWPATGRLSDAEVAAWGRRFAAAWQGVRVDAPEHAGGLRQALRAMTPLVADADGGFRSATARPAFGAVGIAATDDTAALVVMLVHELQHTKLGAVLDLYDFVHPGPRGRIAVGWRPDPRPLDAVLQGSYAHLAVADVWRVRAERGGCGPAAGRFRMYRDWTAAAIGALQASDALTPTGARFVARMGATVDAWPR